MGSVEKLKVNVFLLLLVRTAGKVAAGRPYPQYGYEADSTRRANDAAVR